MNPTASILVLASLLAACHAPGAARPTTASAELSEAVRADLDLPVAEPPYRDVRANWKERLEETYAYVELRGSYTETARALGGLFQALSSASVTPTGVPFALYYDDPAHTSVAELRSRACVPVPADAKLAAPYAVDVLPSAPVVYAYVGGPYGDVPRAYPGIYAYLKKLGWAEAGPLRECYLVSPGSVSDYSRLVTEVQIPGQPTR